MSGVCHLFWLYILSPDDPGLAENSGILPNPMSSIFLGPFSRYPKSQVIRLMNMQKKIPKKVSSFACSVAWMLHDLGLRMLHGCTGCFHSNRCQWRNFYGPTEWSGDEARLFGLPTASCTERLNCLMAIRRWEPNSWMLERTRER